MKQEKRYSEMSYSELREQVSILGEQVKKAEQMGILNQYEVLERKAEMAKSYMLDPNDFKKGEVYEVIGNPGELFQIEYMNGVFAWGFHLNEKDVETALPISLLKKHETEK